MTKFPLSPRLLLWLALLVAAFLRFWQLDSLPPGLYHDEAYYALDALSLLAGEEFPIFYEGWELYAQDAHAERPPNPTRFPVFFEGNYGREPLHVYLVALSIKLFGPTPWAIRAVVAAAGVLGVWTTYLAAQALFAAAPRRSPYLAPLAALALAILYPALTFSRFGIRAMHFVPIETLTVYCFWRGVESVRGNGRSLPWFIAAGFGLGFGLYSYAAARLLPLLFILFIPLWFWQERTTWQQYRRSILLMAGTAIVTAAPLLIFFARYPYFFIFRSSFVANKGLGTVPGKPWLTWLGNIGRVTGGLFWQGEGHLRHNLPGRPYLDAIQATLFLLGLGHLLRPAKDRFSFPWLAKQHLFLLLWLGVMLLPTILSGDAPHFGRMTGAAPVIAIIMATGAIWLIEAMQQSRFSALARYSLPWLLLLFLVSTGLTGHDYFVRYAHHPDLPEFFYVGDWQLGQYAAAQPPDTVLYLTPTQEEMATIYYALRGERERLHSYSATGVGMPVGKPGATAVYFLRPGDEQSLAQLTATFPSGTVGTAGLNYIAFHVPANAPRIRAENPADVIWDGQIRLVGWSQQVMAEQVVVQLFWQAETEMALAYTAFVHLLDANGTVVAQLDRPPGGYPTTDWQPGEVIVDSYAILLSDSLDPGSYSLATGFYYLPTLERLGEPAQLGTVEIR